MSDRPDTSGGTVPGLQPKRARVRSHWFRNEQPRRPEDIAAAVAFVIWRISGQVMANMRGAAFEIPAGARYFDFLCEWLIYLAQVADRLAAEELTDHRVQFTSVVANRVGETYADNRAELLGDVSEGEAKSAFIDAFNLRLDAYIAFGADEAGRMRYLAQRLGQVAASEDQIWLYEQVMEIEAPHAANHLRRSMLELLGKGPPRTRRESGVTAE